MKLIIDMPDNVYARFLKDDFDLGDFETTRSVIRKGKPLNEKEECNLKKYGWCKDCASKDYCEEVNNDNK